jgi:Putative MetA-pathway of phenol degradation
MPLHHRGSLLAIAFFVLVPTFGLQAQTPERQERRENPFDDPVETDRDAFTPSTKIAGTGRFIFESAYSFIDNRNVPATHSFPEMLIRYGLTERIELRLGWNYEVGGAGSDVSAASSGDGEKAARNSLERDSRISYGLKIQATEQRNWLPESAFIFQGSTPTSGKATDSQFVGTYVFGWKLPNQWKLDSSIRYATASEDSDHFNSWAPSAVLRIPLSERINVHGEYFGIFSANKNEDFSKHYLSPGIHYLITPNIEVGVRVGWGLNDQSARFFSNVGLGWRF